MTTGPITLTVGWVGRHTPPGAGVDGRDAAVIDIAKDVLLRDLHERGRIDARLCPCPVKMTPLCQVGSRHPRSQRVSREISRGGPILVLLGSGASSLRLGDGS